MVLGHYLHPLVRPFYHADSVAPEIILQAEFGDLLGAVKAIEVDMVEGEPAVIFSHDDKGGTKCEFFYLEPACDALDETGLTRSEFTNQQKDI